MEPDEYGESLRLAGLIGRRVGGYLLGEADLALQLGDDWLLLQARACRLELRIERAAPAIISSTDLSEPESVRYSPTGEWHSINRQGTMEACIGQELFAVTGEQILSFLTFVRCPTVLVCAAQCEELMTDFVSIGWSQ